MIKGRRFNLFVRPFGWAEKVSSLRSFCSRLGGDFSIVSAH